MISLEQYIEPYGFIYEIKNLANGKRYIGQTIQKKGIRGFWTLNGIKHEYGNNQYLIRSFEKYGIENFERRIIDSAQNKKELNQKEEAHIQKYNTLNRDYGYNLQSGGSNGKLAEETKIKISKALKGRKLTKETKQKISDANKGKKRTEEVKRKISERLKGKKLSNETKKKMSENNPRYFLGKKLTKEHCKNLSNSHKGYKKSEEVKGKLSNTLRNLYKIGKMKPYWKGKKQSNEANKKRSNTLMGHKVSDETKRKIGESNKGKNKKYFFERRYLIKKYWISEDLMKKRILDDKQKNMVEIAKDNNCNKAVIKDNMINYNIPIRNRSESAKLWRLKN